MKNWNTRRPWSRGLSILMVLSLTISMLSGCEHQGQNTTAQTENSAGYTTESDASATEAAALDTYIHGIISDRVTQDIRQANADLTGTAGAEKEALEQLSVAIASDSTKDAKEALTALAESLSVSDDMTENWFTIQEQAEAEIRSEVSESAEQLLAERAEALKNEITDNRNQAEVLMEELEQALEEGNLEEAEAKTEELKAVLEAGSLQQSYGTGSGTKMYGTSCSIEAPDSALLSLTGETDINEDVMELADELGTPLEIYYYLKNTIQYEYYYGSRKGANGTYASYAGNDYDQASLLIGMLRYLGYEAEYVRGNILLEEEQALALTGADTYAHAADVLAASGVPVTKYTRDGEVIGIQMEHVWVRALLPYTDYRGAGNASGEALWIDLDTGIKAYESVNSIYDAAEDTDLPAGLSDAAERGDEDALESILKGFAEEVTAMELNEVYARKRIIKQEALSYLPASLQYKVEKELDTFPEISNTYKDSISFEAAGEILATYTASELSGRSILLTFLPASEADEEILNSYGTIFDVPASYVHVKPVLLIDGEIAAETEYVETTLGTAYTFTITLNRAGTVADKVKTVNNTVTAGSMYAITIDNQMITGDELRSIYNEVAALADSVTEQNVYSPEYLGQYLSLAGKLYFAELDLYNIEAGEIYGVSSTRKLSEGITGYEVQKISRYGIVTGLAAGSMYIDVDADDHAVISLTGDERTAKAYMMASGNVSSLYESIVWEQLTGYESVSTISIFRKAKEQGIELLQINRDNLDAQLEKLNADDVTRQAVKSAVTGGAIVTIPAESVTIGNWNGTGYIILDTSTGAGSYMISGGLNGGEIPWELTMEVIAGSIAAVLGTATLITALSASIFAVMFPVAAIVAYTALILIATVWIVDMYCSYYDYIYSGNLESYTDTEDMALQLYMLGDAELMLSQFVYSYSSQKYLGSGTEDAEETDSVFSKNITVDTVNENLESLEGKGVEEIAQMMRSQGYDVVIRDSTRPTSNAVIIEVNNVSETAGRNVKQVQVSPGGGRHGPLPYIKISTVSSGVGKIKVVMGPEELYNPDGEKNVTVIFTGGD